MLLTQGMEDSKSVAKLSEVVERGKTFSQLHWEITFFGFHKLQRYLHCLLLKKYIYLQSI